MYGNYNGYLNANSYQPQNGYQPQNNYQQYTQAQTINPALAAANQGNMQDERIWVPSAAAAEAFPVAANSFVRLWHSTQPIFYEKSADAIGRPSPLIAYEYKILGTDTEQQTQQIQAVNTLDYEQRIKSLEERIEALEKSSTSTGKSGKKEVLKNE